jgi:cation diffusion facilitator CzcD-associated flavoprotein CzcO
MCTIKPLTTPETPWPSIETDYLIIGAGASGLAFADTLLDELPDAHITIVDRHGKPGGHWNDAYSFVNLHQPSAFYGVNFTAAGRQPQGRRGHQPAAITSWPRAPRSVGLLQYRDEPEAAAQRQGQLITP